MRRLPDADRLWVGARAKAGTRLDEYGERVSRARPATSLFTLDLLVGQAGADEVMARLGR